MSRHPAKRVAIQTVYPSLTLWRGHATTTPRRWVLLGDNVMDLRYTASVELGRLHQFGGGAWVAQKARAGASAWEQNMFTERVDKTC